MSRYTLPQNNNKEKMNKHWSSLYENLSEFLSHLKNSYLHIEEDLKLLDAINSSIKSIKKPENINFIIKCIENIENGFNSIIDNNEDILDKFEYRFPSIMKDLYLIKECIAYDNKNIIMLESYKYIEEIDKISKLLKKYEQNYSNIEKFLKETSSQREALEDALNQVHGEKNEKGERTGGLITELETRSQEMQEKYVQVKAVGLAGAYSDELKDLKDITRYYNIAFYISLIVIPIAMIIVYILIETIPLESFSKLGNTTSIIANIAFIVTNFLIKLPFILPFIWLSIFLAKRRAETVRLKQEYTHKLTVAKTYISYNEQIKNLNQSDQDKLSALLLENMIQMIYHNPATTLDKQQRSDSPLEEMYNRLNKEHTYMEKIKEFFVKKDEK